MNKVNAGQLFVMTSVLLASIAGLCLTANAGWELDYDGLGDGPTLEAIGTTYHIYYDDPPSLSNYFGSRRIYKAGYKWEEYPVCEESAAVDLYDTPWNVTAPAFPQTSESNESIWTWIHDGQGSPSNYVFHVNVRGHATADAEIAAKQYLIWRGYGKLEAHGFIRLTGDTSLTSPAVSEKSVWVGAEVTPTGSGLTGFGLGADSGSINWSEPEDGWLNPYDSKGEMASIFDTTQNPGVECSIKCEVVGRVQGGTSFFYLYGHHYVHSNATGHGSLDSSYESLQFGPPTEL